jgi:hypothetical protein
MPLFSIPLSGLDAASTAMSAIANKQVNHPTAGRVPNGGLVERDTSLDLRKLTTLPCWRASPISVPHATWRL